MTNSLTPEIETMLAKIAELRPFIAERGPEGERQRKVVPEVFEALKDIGVFRASLPQRYGGLAAGVRDKLELSRAVARADGGSGWITAIILGNNWILGFFPKEAQDDVFLADPDACLSAVVPVSGRADKAEGGYRISGKWGYNSALSYTSWVLVAAVIHDENGEFMGTGQIMLPRAKVDEEDTWYVSGMKSSDSNTIVVDDVLVPDHHVLFHEQAISGVTATENDQGFRSAFVSSLTTWLIGPQLGLAEGIYDLVAEKALTKGIAYTTFETQADSTAVQLRIAKARLGIDTALLVARTLANELDDYANREENPDYLSRARIRANTGWITELLKEAVESLLDVHGSGAFADANPIQRHWRDLAIAARHALILPDVGYEVYGRTLLGRPGNEIAPLI